MTQHSLSSTAGVQPHYYPAGVQSHIPDSPALLKQVLLVVSALTGGLAIAMSLELMPPVTASHLGLSERGSFYLLMAGIYLIVSACYAAWRTRLLQNVSEAPWDARLMAYGNLVVGAAVSAALAAVLLIGMAILALLLAPLLLVLKGWGDPYNTVTPVP